MTLIRTCLIGVSGFGAVHYNDLLREVGAGRMQAVAATVINQGEEAGGGAGSDCKIQID